MEDRRKQGTNEGMIAGRKKEKEGTNEAGRRDVVTFEDSVAPSGHIADYH